MTSSYGTPRFRAAHPLPFPAQGLPKICAVPAKRRGARRRTFRHTGDVNPTPPPRLVALFPAIKAEWSARLRGEPVVTPLGRPDTLAFLMDATLQQWAAGLRATDRTAWLRDKRTVTGPVHQHCACGLNPLTNYFGTGEAAIAAVAGGVLAAHAPASLGVFRALAQHEIDTLCSLCVRPERTACAARSGRNPRSPCA